MAKTAFNFYVTSDSHVNHANVLKFANRPFSSLEDMDNELVTRCNRMVRPQDILIVLGDWIWTAFGSEAIQSWMKKFNGRIILVKGNHDKRSYSFYLEHGVQFICERFVWEFGGKRILFIHDPHNVSDDEIKKYDYIIHGHTHQNRPLVYKIRGKYFVNVSVENTRYAPLNLLSLLNKIRDGHFEPKRIQYGMVLDYILYNVLHWSKA